MTSKLTVVATPIGNLGDLSDRAKIALREADVVCAEDTRHTKPLLDRIGSTQARLLSVHAHNERERAPEIIALLQQGKRVCFVSDAGCPGISDPGSRLVEALVEAGVDVEVLPGPSALTTALMGAGIDMARFAFLGFLPRKGKERETLVKHALQAGFGVVVYEAANRTVDLLADLFELCGPRRVVVARELTKLHETFHRGLLGQDLHPALVEKGEVVVVVEAADPIKETSSSIDLATLVGDPTLTPKEKARQLAHAQGISVREAYARLQASSSTSGKGEVQRASRLLAEAAHALLHGDDLARAQRGGAVDDSAPAGSDIAGADAILKVLSRPPSLPAPVEVQEAAKALLAALSTMDALLEAMND
ncbi:MAG: 16S rRNA (cytidine(1402)-2'-O)-methyltransferase [Deltaproteobacteria bacterium]|nr:16S rRNA (cytidine(1402)-2'-O)-methyltransferase [Deltaproteobacteria bacterium]